MAESVENEITKCNYEARLCELIELIKMADFVAIDCTVETTGFLLRDETFNPAYMSDVDDWTGSWYDTIKSKERSHCLLEVGVAVFKRIPDAPMELEAEVFNIPVLPACVDDNEIARFRGRTSVRLQFDGYGQEFIKEVDFDMNKVFYMAAPYLNRELQLQADIYMKDNPNFMVATRKRRLNPHLMPELFEEVTEKERESIIERLKGVSKVFEAISAEEIPVIGHHLLLKLIFIYKDFFEYLPDTYPECMEKIGDKFKVVYDTKQLATHLFQNYGGAHSPSHLERQKSGGNLSLYELLRKYSSNEDGFSIHVGGRSDLYVIDLVDIFKGIEVEEELDGFCFLAGFDALACGVLFLDLVSSMDKTKLSYYGLQIGTESNCDLLETLLKGGPGTDQFKNKLYGAPQIPDRDTLLFSEMLQSKKQLWLEKRAEEEKEKQANARKPILLPYSSFHKKPTFMLR